MANLVLAVLTARRIARNAAPLACALALGALVVLDAAAPLPPLAAATALLVLLVALVQRARRRAAAIEASALLDLEVGALLLVATFAAVLRLDGSLDGDAQAALYVVIALVSAFARPGASLLVAIAAAALEIAVRSAAAASGGSGAPSLLDAARAAAPHIGFMAVFSLLNATILRAELGRVRKASHTRLQAEIERLRDDARSYRLLSAPAQARGAGASQKGDDERLARSGVEEIHQSVLFALRLLRESLDLYTAVLLWQNDAGTHLRISELASDAPNLSEGPFLSGDGVFGAAITQRAPVVLGGLKPGYKLPYYVGPSPVRAVCALPVFEHGQLRGVLVVDRVEDRPFSPRELELIDEACRYAVRAIQNERVFVQLERAKIEQGKLYRAAEGLGAATTEAGVIEAGVTSAREITSVDFAAVTLYDEAQKVHEIRAVSGDGVAELTGQRFRHNAGLVSMVLQNRHPLPYRGEYDEKRQVVFTRRVTPPSMPSIIVLPLVVHDRPLGTLVLGSRRRAAFTDSVRSTLEVLASHMAVSLSNARMVRRLEELATMDGLTGLLNKRAMLEVADQKITAARRFSRRLSVLVTDIDHFKKVNDTYGHDVGDVIIKGLGDVLRRAKRTTDAVARFGGEEFVVICEETDARGAMLLAERVREELGRTTFHAAGSSGPVQCQVTCSIGIATYPEAGSTWEELFKAADESLYVSKRSGRNRSTAWSPAVRSNSAHPPAAEAGAPAKQAAEAAGAAKQAVEAAATARHAAEAPAAARHAAPATARPAATAAAARAAAAKPAAGAPAPQRRPAVTGGAGGAPAAPGQDGAPSAGKRAAAAAQAPGKAPGEAEPRSKPRRPPDVDPTSKPKTAA
ncbi:putative membrane protein (GAF and GGDEF domain) [Sorangium cellulosum So ce56]|uniref:diguanylate cyclase n=1 Tax=Sorangium cellulosum (strain So ce56) TaxID=448385 RepID=A9FTU9_SORC5|nr:sensor domain-containing diguanylate cyclase [Sorangium cellulosum]CAN98567.1 putative membrane protein (GAF and GGDEF domain) [Sorangium cellulosum So ce56]